MTRIERFIEINSGSTNRKTFLLLRVALPLHVANWLVIHWVGGRVPLYSLTIADFGFGLTALGFAICLVSSYAAFRLGKEIGWPTYLMVIIQAIFMVGAAYSMGYWSTPISVLSALSGIMLVLYYDRAVWLFGLVLYALLAVSVGILDITSVIPYAPALSARTVDEQQNGFWILAVITPVLGFSVFCFVYGVWTVEARKLQEKRLQAAQALIRRYVPSQLAERISRGEHALESRHERKKLTIFFSDVVGFTDASDELDAEELAVILNEYLSEMSVIAGRHGATINQFVGDGIMIFFGAPTATSDRDHALRAVRMSLEMQRRLQELQDIWHERGIQRPFRARIGINTGHASVGDFGSDERKVYSAIGIQTNLAARIQARCEPGKILISHSTWALVHEEIVCEPKGELQVKGIHYPIKVYEVTDGSQPVPG